MQEVVTFSSSSPFTLEQAGPQAKETLCRGLLALPLGTGRRPAVVLIEGLGGLQSAREIAYGKRLAAQGYVTLVVDSFASRRVEGEVTRAVKVSEAMLLADAFAAMRFLRSHPRVLPERVAIAGFSYGGMVSVLAAYEQLRDLFATAEERFAAHVSYYGCSAPRLVKPVATGAPVLLLLGERDRNVSIERSRQIAEDLRGGGSPVTLEILPDAYHQWDGPNVKPYHVPVNLTRCRISVSPDNAAYDERSGLRLRGPISRALVIGLSLDPRGYLIHRNEAAHRQSDASLGRFLTNNLRDDGGQDRKAQ